MDGPVASTSSYRFSQPQYTEIPDASFCRLIRISLHVTRLVPALAAPPPMPDRKMNIPSQDIFDLAFLALNHAVKSVVRTNGPMVPFAILESANGERGLARFMTGRNPEETRQRSRIHVAEDEDCVKYAIAADGSVTENGRRIPVVMVELGERGKPGSISFVQRFASNSECRFSKPVGDPRIIDSTVI
jgi:hypothetical protein